MEENDKIEFKNLIVLLKKINHVNIVNLENENIKLMNIVTSIILKYHNTTNWFLKKFLYYFFQNDTNIYYILNNTSNFKNQCPLELKKILHIIKKYKLSEMLELFLKQINVKFKHATNIKNWFNLNKNIFDNYFCGISILIPLLIKDITIPNKNNCIETKLYQKELYIIIVHLYYLLN